MLLIPLIMMIIMVYLIEKKKSGSNQNDTSGISECKQCGYILKDESIYCPRCREKIKKKCANCGKVIDITWRKCPFC